VESVDNMKNQRAEDLLKDLLDSYETVGSEKVYVLKDLFLHAVDAKSRWLNAKEFFIVVITEEGFFSHDVIAHLEEEVSKTQKEREEELYEEEHEGELEHEHE